MGIITLCGSTKFKDDFERINKELTLQGNVVITVAFFAHSGDSITEEQKQLLDKIHKAKIDLSDSIFVINKNDYIGSSTKSEIEYAKKTNKKIIFMENAKKAIKFEPIPSYGDHMSIQKYLKNIEDRTFIPYDGYGYYATEDKISDVLASFDEYSIKKVISNKEFDYVVWFNR